MTEVLIFATVLAPIVTAVIEILKRTLPMNERCLPILAVVLAVGIGAIATPFTEMVLTERLWAGALAGLSAMGLFDLATKPGKE